MTVDGRRQGSSKQSRGQQADGSKTQYTSASGPPPHTSIAAACTAGQQLPSQSLGRPRQLTRLACINRCARDVAGFNR